MAILFPHVDDAERLVLAAFCIGQGATTRKGILRALRVAGGEVALVYARNSQPPMKLNVLGSLEDMVWKANPRWHPEGLAAPGPIETPVAKDEHAIVDFGQLRPLLDQAMIGEPTKQGVPRQGMLDMAESAARKHTLPSAKPIEPGEFPKGWEERPLAKWLQDAVRRFWCQTLTGVAGVGDCLNRLSHVSSVALDHRFDAHVA